MPIGPELAVGVRTHLGMVPRFSAVGRDGEALITRRNEFHRAIELPGRHRNKHSARRHAALRSERAANERRDSRHLRRLNVQLPRQPVFIPKTNWLGS